MKYVSIDLETTGLDSDNDQILEIGAIIEDTNDYLSFDDAPKFHAIVKHNKYHGDAFAINLNQRIFKILADRTFLSDDEKVAYDDKYNVVPATHVMNELYMWLYENIGGVLILNDPIKIIVAGKNVASFDIPFLNNLQEKTLGYHYSHVKNKKIQFGHRVIDPAMLYMDFMSDLSVPSLETCLERADFEPNVTHDAIQDAWDVIKVCRHKYNPVEILEETVSFKG